MTFCLITEHTDLLLRRTQALRKGLNRGFPTLLDLCRSDENSAIGGQKYVVCTGVRIGTRRLVVRRRDDVAWGVRFANIMKFCVDVLCTRTLDVVLDVMAGCL